MTLSRYLSLPGVKDENATTDQVKEAELILQGVFSEVFRKEEARIVLGCLLEDFFVFRPATTPDEMALKNYGTLFLTKRLGITLSPDTLNALLGRAEE